MVHKVLSILLCVGIVSLLSGCYCYPAGFYHHHAYRHSYASPSPSNAPHVKEAHGGV